jgi:hypothetical protein
MTWYCYFAGFFSGIFLANFVPHFVQGISGNRFPTPFAKPPGKGLSSPTLNVIWGLLNLLAGYFLFRLGRVSAEDRLSGVVFFSGIALISILMSKRFAGKDQSVMAEPGKIS